MQRLHVCGSMEIYIPKISQNVFKISLSMSFLVSVLHEYKAKPRNSHVKFYVTKLALNGDRSREPEDLTLNPILGVDSLWEGIGGTLG